MISSHQPDSEQISKRVKDGKINGKDATELGIPSSHPQPPPVECQFCGKTLYHEGAYIFGFIPCWSPMPERCDCPEAKAFWAKEDAIAAEKKAEEERLEKARRQQERYERLLGNSGMGKRFLQRTFETYECRTAEQKRAYLIAKRFADTFGERLKDGRGLYIEGTNGTGKTHLAAAISLQLMRECHTVIFRTYGDLLDEVKKSYDRDGGTTEYELSQLYRNCDLLVIDDLGKEQCTDWSVSFLYGVINDRYMHEGGQIYQLDSLSAFQPVPYITVYGATKAFVLSFSRALNVELKARKIRCMAVCPGWVKTEFFDRAVRDDTITYYNKFFTPDQVIRRALRDMKRGRDVSVCGASIRAQVRLVKLLPHRLVMKIWCRQQKK